MNAGVDQRMATHLVFASSETSLVVGLSVVVTGRPEVARFHESRTRRCGTPRTDPETRSNREQVCARHPAQTRFARQARLSRRPRRHRRHEAAAGPEIRAFRDSWQDGRDARRARKAGAPPTRGRRCCDEWRGATRSLLFRSCPCAGWRETSSGRSLRLSRLAAIEVVPRGVELEVAVLPPSSAPDGSV